MSNIHNAQNEHVPFKKINEDNKKVSKDRVGRHPNKGRSDRHPVSGK